MFAQSANHYVCEEVFGASVCAGGRGSNAAAGLRPWREQNLCWQGKQWRLGLSGIGLGLLGAVTQLKSVSHWLSGSSIPDARTFLVFFGCVFFFVPVGVLLILNAVRGLPRLIASRRGVMLKPGLGTKWANWNSLEPFAVKKGMYGRLVASARVVGDHASSAALRAKSFSIHNNFQIPIGTIVDEINTVRARAMGGAQVSFSSATVPGPTPVGLAAFRLPWLTLGLLAVLVVVFAMEYVFAVTPSVRSNPSIATLFALGGLIRTAVLSGGQWYRLFTAPLLHLNFIHIVGNGIALLFGGWLLERLVGRLWFFALFVIGALGGSLMPLAVMPANLISVGASGALMALFAALFISSFRVPAGMPARSRLQVSSMRILVPSLLPLASTTSVGHIDYGAHIGGALSGAAVAVLLLKFWPASERIPRLRKLAAGISVVGVVLFVASAGMVIGNYTARSAALKPQAVLPKPGVASNAMSTYINQIIYILEQNKTYPADAINRREEGTAIVSFTLNRSGHIIGKRLVQSTGSMTLDWASLDLLDRSQPFPPLPPTYSDNQLTMRLPA